MRHLIKSAFFENNDQGQYSRVFAPGEAQNNPTRGSFAGFLPLVHLACPVTILQGALNEGFDKICVL